MIGMEVLPRLVSSVAFDQAITQIKQRDWRGRLESMLAGPMPSAIELVDFILRVGHSLGASDIHLAPQSEGISISLRIGGAMSCMEVETEAANYQRIVRRLKVLANLDTSIKSKPQDGAFTVDLKGKKRLRLSLIPTVHGEKAVMRMMHHAAATLEELGLEPQIEGFLKSYCCLKEGAVLFSGPTGSGKSTSMYAIIKHLLAKGKTVSTAEDPVEQFITGASQTSINPLTGLDYSSALRAILRQDPDVIMLGEIRDGQSAAAAIQAALTGHLVVSTVHARNVFDIFHRLSSLGLDNFLIARAAKILVNQRLMPKLCIACKVTDLRSSNECGFEVFQAVGCSLCSGQGFQGQALASEALYVSERLEELIRLGDLQRAVLADPQAYPEYLSLKSSLVRLLRSGGISMSQVKQGAI